MYSDPGAIYDSASDQSYLCQKTAAFFYYHYDGLDLLTTKKDVAIKNIVKLIKDLETLKAKVGITGVLIKTFFDAKSGEIISCLKNYPDKTIFVALKKIDPPHTSKYDDAMQEN